jgi:hypothetical protein
MDAIKGVLVQLVAGIMTAAIFSLLLPAVGSEYHLPSVIAGIFIFAVVDLAGKTYE